MIPADNINDLIKKLKLKASTDLDRRVHDDISKMLVEKESAVKQPSIRKMIMRSPITKLVAAASVILVCAIGLSLWRGTESGIALADVLTRIEQVTGYAYQLSSTATKTKQQLTGSRTSTVLVSKEHGIKMTITKSDPNSAQMLPHHYAEGTEWYVLPKSSSIVLVNHKEKTYNRTKFADGFELPFYKQEYCEPRTIIKKILSCEHNSLGQSIIDGITVEGFRTTDLAYGGGFFGEADSRQGELEKADVKLWVDVDTFLPIRVETDIVTKKKRYRIREVSYDFRWNIVINPNDFEPRKPSDYHSDTPEDVVIRGESEENTTKALRLFADAVGHYPASLELKPFMSELKASISIDPNAYEGYSGEDKTRKSLNEWLLMTNPASFYKPLVDENKDPAYYGETVGPDDVDKVLLRWKLDDGRYRVIFGGLSVKTVTAEEMAGLEKP